MGRITTYIGSLNRLEDRLKAARLLSEGELIALFNRGVNAIWLNGSNPKAVAQVPKIKGAKRIGRPLALTIPFAKLLKVTDLEKISSDGRKILEDSKNLSQELGSLCFIRVPAKPSSISSLPECAVFKDGEGEYWVQSWDPHGHPFTEHLLKTAYNLGVKFPVVTSMNNSGEPESVSQEEGERFCENKGIKIYLRDENADLVLVGSYSIITFTKEGIELTRDGNIPGKVLEKLLGTKIIYDKAKKPHHKQKEFPLRIFNSMSRRQMRQSLLLYLNSHSRFTKVPKEKNL